MRWNLCLTLNRPPDLSLAYTRFGPGLASHPNRRNFSLWKLHFNSIIWPSGSRIYSDSP